MEILVGLIFALAIEIRENRIKQEDLNGRAIRNAGGLVGLKANSLSKAIDEADARYNEVEMRDPIISDQTFVYPDSLKSR